MLASPQVRQENLQSFVDEMKIGRIILGEEDILRGNQIEHGPLDITLTSFASILKRGRMRILMLLGWVQVLSAQGPPEFSLTLRLLNPHVFRQGEHIAAEVNLPHPAVLQNPPAAEQWQFAGILLDPPVGCGTVVKPCVLNEPYLGGIFSPSDHTSLELNSYLPQL